MSVYNKDKAQLSQNCFKILTISPKALQQQRLKIMNIVEQKKTFRSERSRLVEQKQFFFSFVSFGLFISINPLQTKKNFTVPYQLYLYQNTMHTKQYCEVRCSVYINSFQAIRPASILHIFFCIVHVYMCGKSMSM